MFGTYVCECLSTFESNLDVYNSDHVSTYSTTLLTLFLGQKTFKIWNTLHKLETVTANAASQQHVLGHDGHTLGVNGAQIGVFKQSDQERFSRLLKSEHRLRLEAQFGFEVHRDIADQTLKR